MLLVKIWNEIELSKMVEGGIPYPMLSDQNGNIGRAYGVYSEEQGVNFRGRFLIDPKGIVQAMEVLTPPVGRNPAELIRQIKLISIIRKQERLCHQVGQKVPLLLNLLKTLQAMYGRYGNRKIN